MVIKTRKIYNCISIVPNLMLLKYFIITFLCVLLLSCAKPREKMQTNILLETSLGNMTVQLFDDKAPITARNFKMLVEKKFYDGTIFHRVIKNFMAQGGDPTGTGTGGPGYLINDEFHPSLKHDRQGLFSMANAGPNTGGSQFFITLAPAPWLDRKHSIFGEVTQGLDVLEKIGSVDTDEHDRPIHDVVIKQMVIIS